MRVLILSCNTGEGHNRAAAAVGIALKNKNIEYEIADPIGFGSERAKRIVSSSYNSVIKNVPKVFSAIYKIGEVYSNSNLPSPIYYANTLYAEKLKTYITEKEFDCVICTHLYAMEAMTAIRKKWNCSVPCYGVLTDYTCVPFFKDTELDGYFIPHEDLRDEMVQKGFPEEKIYATGIPVDERFNNGTSKEAARNVLAIPREQSVVLLMGGGVGCGNMLELCRELLNQSDSIAVYVLVGKNEALADKLKEAYPESDRIIPVAFTDKVSIYMRAADVMISKAGGLSSTEAAVANIPLVQLLVYTACEAKNADFFVSHGMSVKAEDARDAAGLAIELLHDSAKANKMRDCQRETINRHAAGEIVRIVSDGYEQ